MALMLMSVVLIRCRRHADPGSAHTGPQRPPALTVRSPAQLPRSGFFWMPLRCGGLVSRSLQTIIVSSFQVSVSAGTGRVGGARCCLLSMKSSDPSDPPPPPALTAPDETQSCLPATRGPRFHFTPAASAQTVHLESPAPSGCHVLRK